MDASTSWRALRERRIAEPGAAGVYAVALELGRAVRQLRERRD